MSPLLVVLTIGIGILFIMTVAFIVVEIMQVVIARARLGQEKLRTEYAQKLAEHAQQRTEYAQQRAKHAQQRTEYAQQRAEHAKQRTELAQQRATAKKEPLVVQWPKESIVVQLSQPAMAGTSHNGESTMFLPPARASGSIAGGQLAQGQEQTLQDSVISLALFGLQCQKHGVMPAGRVVGSSPVPEETAARNP